jgi:DNA-binding IclR family transcriptional regulator
MVSVIDAQNWTRTVAEARDRPDGAQTIHRAFMILRALAAGGETGLGLTDLARATGLARPTAHRVLRALMGEGVVTQKPRTRRYVAGKSFQVSAFGRTAATPLLEAAIPHLEEAAAEIGDTLFLTVRTGLETVCVARRLGDYPIQVLLLDAGVSRPLGVSSAGIAMLATLRPAAARRILHQNFRHLGAYGLTFESSLAAIAEARRMGFALRERGLVPGTRALSVALAHHAAALTTAGVVRRLHAQRVPAIVQRLRLCGERIEGALRHPG